MRYLVFGDVHGNLSALQAVFDAATPRGFDTCLFVGDLVGYGPDPLPCIDRLRELHEEGRLAWVAGNHDLVARADDPIDGYIPEAAQTLAWTRRLLSQRTESRDFLAAAPTKMRVDDRIWLTHDSIVEPGSGTYHRDLLQAARELGTIRGLGGRVCFYGHTHVLRAEILEHRHNVKRLYFAPHAADETDPSPLLLLPHQTAWIGVGSVGLPKNRGRLAEFLILDTEDDQVWVLEKYAIPYPRFQTRASIHQNLALDCSPEVVETIARWL